MMTQSFVSRFFLLLLCFTLTLGVYAGGAPAASVAPGPEVAAPATAPAKAEIKAAKKELRKQAMKSFFSPKETNDLSTDDLIILIVTIILPPLGVFLYEGDFTTRFWISLILTLLLWLPGLIYSLLVVTGTI